ncbi:MAG: prepilin-type N-terminal cleavage/methylation domain-containing protein [Candidatus Sungbacteria bacterium]|nr:prepilin-type N-terminal cleavage/methylation domain-containing protein [Candidatus Sungbacteria bacterium]
MSSFFGGRKQDNLAVGKNNSGFSLIELLVVIGIGTLLMTAAIASTMNARRSNILEQSGRKLLLDVRSLQNKALSVRPVSISGTPVTPWSYIIRLSQRSGENTQYLLFADINNNKIYDSGTDVVLNNNTPVALPTGIIIQAIAPPVYPAEGANIVFQLPSATALLVSPVSGASVSNSLVVTLTDAITGSTRTLTVYTTGMVSLK